MKKLPAAVHRYRPALDHHPYAPRPTVSVIVPVRNEIACLDHLFFDLLAQDYAAIVEIWFADGHSDDGTYEALLRLAAQHEHIRVLRNSKRGPAAGINLALQHATGDIVMRLDAHARYETSVVSMSVRALLMTGAGGVGAIARPAPGRTLTERAIVAAHVSPIGVGVAKFRRENAEGWADTIWNGCYWRHVVERVGPLREDLHRAEDNDFNARIRALGYGLYLSSEIRAYYVPRRALSALWRQYFATGIGIALATRDTPTVVSWRHLVPMAFVLALSLSSLAAAVWAPFERAALFVVAAYVTALISAVVIGARREAGAHLLLLPAALATLHFSYGLGSLWGFARPRVRRERPCAP
jgi:succinoglycan biosynthesis protein ExoA